MAKKNDKLRDTSTSVSPVVAVLGHVDHGKTTLLDSIRKTNIAQKEHGGITQRIGASSIQFNYERKTRKITFIDTPGHEAFSRMRGRGIQAADIGLLVVSSVDGVMPQTKESIKLFLESKTPFIVVLTKGDLPDKSPEKVKQQLLKEGIMLEGYGGDVPVIEVSAKTNINILELLELILLVFEMRQENLKTGEQGEFKAIVIESRLDQKAGPKATIVIKNGSILVKDKIICEGIEGNVRAIINDRGEYLDKAGVGDAVEVLGFEKVPGVGSVVSARGPVRGFPPTGAPASLANAANAVRASGSPSTSATPRSDKFPEIENPALSVIICADTLGSLEAIINALPKEIWVALQKTGSISPADILFAKSIGSIILGFNIKIKPEILKQATQEKVLLKNYNLIYEFIDEVNDVLKGKQLKLEEEIFGRALVIASFPFEKTKVLGISVLEGRVARGDKVRLISPSADGEIIGESVISSLRVGKTSVSKVEKGQEAGIILSPFLDFNIGNMLICHG